jgi:hypothetical protein
MRSIGEWELTHTHRATGVLRASASGSTPRIGSAHRCYSRECAQTQARSRVRQAPFPAKAGPAKAHSHSRLGAFAFPLRRIRISAKAHSHVGAQRSVDQLQRRSLVLRHSRLHERTLRPE